MMRIESGKFYKSEDSSVYERSSSEQKDTVLLSSVAQPCALTLNMIDALHLSEQRSIYLSGPMTGLPEYNYPLFTKVAAQLRFMGHTVYNPAEFQHNGELADFPLEKAFEEYTTFIIKEADTLVMLPGWEKSNGARAEYYLGVSVKRTIVHLTVPS